MNSTLNIYGRSALLAITLISGDLFAGDAMFVYRGEAKNQGKIVYIERHRVFLDQAGKIERAETEYERSDGSKIASLSSDFRSSLTSPDHTIIDLRTGEVQGVRRESEKIVLFYKEKDKPEETKTLTGEEIHERVLVGCQG
ncbi:MAG TPA: hypothetical protein PLH57_00985, partial [Oligoflexia bacterium]|nr:hypothetical protein [Oligoflexia bacterium]